MAVRVLTVCTHNRTRSVLMGGLLTYHFRELGIDGAVRTAGFSEPGMAPTEYATRYLRSKGVRADDHRSRRIEPSDVERSDLIIVAERIHVVEIAGQWPDAFDSCFTLPEIVDRATALGGRRFADLGEWKQALGVGRDRMDFLDDSVVPEVVDPTGGSPASWRQSAAQIDELTGRLCQALVTVVGGSA